MYCCIYSNGRISWDLIQAFCDNLYKINIIIIYRFRYTHKCITYILVYKLCKMVQQLYAHVSSSTVHVIIILIVDKPTIITDM